MEKLSDKYPHYYKEIVETKEYTLLELFSLFNMPHEYNLAALYLFDVARSGSVDSANNARIALNYSASPMCVNAYIVNSYNRSKVLKKGLYDVYRVCLEYNVTNPCLAHAIKKLLCMGIRGHKSADKDKQEVDDSLIRYIELVTDDSIDIRCKQYLSFYSLCY